MHQKDSEMKIRQAIARAQQQADDALPPLPEDFEVPRDSGRPTALRSKSLVRRGQGLRRIRKIAAMLALVLLSGFFTTMLLSRQARADVGRFLKEVWEDRILLLFRGEKAPDYQLPNLYASYLPEGVELVLEEKSEQSCNRIYHDKDIHCLIYLSYQLVEEGRQIRHLALPGMDLETLLIGERRLEHFSRGEEDHTAWWFEEEDKLFVQVKGVLNSEEFSLFVQGLRQEAPAP